MQTETSLCDYSLGKRRRSDDDSSSSELPLKRPTSQKWYYVLESESSRLDSCDDETIYSLQDVTTDWVQDTPDTDSEPRMIEFEVASSSSSPEFVNGYSESSEPEDKWIDPVNVGSQSSCDSPMEEFSSNESQTDMLNDSIKHVCFDCGSQKTSHPQLTVCDKCFKVKKRFCPPHTRRKRRHRDELIKLNTLRTSKFTSESQETVRPSTLESSQVSEIELLTAGYCKLCCSMPQNSVFVHKRIGHMIGCYECSSRIWKTRGRCPVCNKEIENVIKLVIS